MSLSLYHVVTCDQIPNWKRKKRVGCLWSHLDSHSFFHPSFLPSIHPSTHSLMCSHSHSFVHLFTQAAVNQCLHPPLCQALGRWPVLKELSVSPSGLPTGIVSFLCTVSVPPAVTVSQSSPTLDVMAITCLELRFYPQSVHPTWLENSHMFKGAE